MWFTEDPWTPAAILTIAILVLAALWTVTRKSQLIWAITACLIAAAFSFAIDSLVVTPREQIEQHVVDLASNFQQQDVEGTLEFFSSKALLERGLITWGLEHVKVEPDLRITDQRVKIFAENSRAESEFRANGTVSGFGMEKTHQPSRWRLTWQMEGENWRVVKVERLNVVTGETMGLATPSQ